MTFDLCEFDLGRVDCIFGQNRDRYAIAEQIFLN